jgi:hypothetical protein
VSSNSAGPLGGRFFTAKPTTLTHVTIANYPALMGGGLKCPGVGTDDYPSAEGRHPSGRTNATNREEAYVSHHISAVGRMPKRTGGDGGARDHRNRRGAPGGHDSAHRLAAGDRDAARERYTRRNGHGGADRHTGR